MIWPDVPTCHDLDPSAQIAAQRGWIPAWRPPRPPKGDDLDRGEPYHSCSYCGSISAEDLYPMLVANKRVEREDFRPTMEGSHEDYMEAMRAHYVRQRDVFRVESAHWKYGWPHKFYVDGAPNPWAGMPMIVSARSSGDDRLLGDPEPAPPTERVKFYSDHLRDLTDPATFEAVAKALFEHTGILFYGSGGQLKYLHTPNGRDD